MDVVCARDRRCRVDVFECLSEAGWNGVDRRYLGNIEFIKGLGLGSVILCFSKSDRRPLLASETR